MRLLRMKEKVKGIAIFAVVIGGAYWLIDSEINKIGEWPESIIENNYDFCTLATISSCNGGDWFGIYESELPDFATVNGVSTTADPRSVLCQPIGYPPSSQKHRIIATQGGDELRLCRLKSKEELLNSVNSVIKGVE